jgi:hypothetical protein
MPRTTNYGGWFDKLTMSGSNDFMGNKAKAVMRSAAKHPEPFQKE